jgi:hypothetical protein
MGQAGEETEVGLRPGLEGECQYGKEEHRGEGGEGGQALARVAGHGGRLARVGRGPQGDPGGVSTVDRISG